MGTINDKLTYLDGTKTAIRNVLNEQGIDITTEDTFRSYAQKIGNEFSDLNDVIENLPTSTVQGTTISVDDCLGGRNPITIKGNTEQASYEGKNLFNIGNTTVSSRGINWIPQNDGSVKIQGTAAGTSTYGFTSEKTIPAGQYRFSIKNPMSQKLKLRCKKISDDTYHYVSLQAGNTSAIVVLPEDVSSIQLYIDTELLAGDELDYTIYPQLEQGSEAATDFEPYVGGPSPNPDYPQDIHVVTGENTIEINGSNIFDEEIELGTVNYSNGNNTDSTRIIRSKNYIPIISNFTIITKEPFESEHVLGFRFYDESYNYIGRTTSSQFKNYATVNTNNALDTTKSVAYMRFIDTSADGNTTEKFAIRIDNGTDYEPYYHQEYPVNLSSKNLFNKNNFPVLTGYIHSSNTINAAENYQTTFIKCKPNTIYTISKSASSPLRVAYSDLENPTLGSSTGGYQRNTDADKQILTITTGPNAKNLVITYKEQGYVADENINTLLVEEGSTATDYQDYYNIELCKIGDYQDYLYKENGNWYKYGAIEKFILDGSETWVSNTGNNASVKIMSFNAYKRIPGNICYSDYYTSKINSGYGEVGLNQICFRYSENDTNNYLYVGVDTNITNAQFKSWLSTHNTSVYYVLATPTATQITDQTLISQLEAINKAKWNKGTNTITTATESSNAVPELQATYKRYPKYQDKDVTVTSNGTTTIQKDEGYDAINSINLNVAVPPNWTEIGYKDTPQTIIDGFNYAKQVQANWNPDATSLNGKFRTDTNLLILPYVDTSKATNFFDFCRDARHLIYIPLIDTSKATTLQSAFSGVSIINFPNLDTSSCTNFNYTFGNNKSLKHFKTIDTSKGKDFTGMFKDSEQLQDVDLLDLSSATNLQNMFSNCNQLTDYSLNNIMAMCIGATAYTGTKTLRQLGLNSNKATRATQLENYTAFVEAGWTTGY